MNNELKCFKPKTECLVINSFDNQLFVTIDDKVYELKKKAFQNAFNILDFYEIYGMDIRGSKQFIQKAKSAYNDLMCVANSPKVYEDFYTLTLDPNYTQITIQNIADFKTLCRTDLGLHNKKNKHNKYDQ